MVNNNNYIAPQQLQHLAQAYGTVINQIVNRLFAKLSVGSVMPWESDAPRMYAELREAKSLLRQLRFLETGVSMRADELAWALKTVKGACATDIFGAHIDVFDKAAAMIGADLNNQDMPGDLQRKINNEMKLFNCIFVPTDLAQAV